MKTQITKVAAKIGSMLLLAIGTVSLTACPDKNNGNNPAISGYNPGVYGGAFPGGGIYPGGGGAVAGGQLIASGFGYVSADNSVALGLAFYGTGAMSAQGYAGAVTATGEFYATQAAYSQSCPVMPGTYQVRTATPGQWSGQSFGGLQMVAQGASQYGATQIYMTLNNNWVTPVSPAAVSPSGAQYPYHLQGYLNVVGVAINGQYIQCASATGAFYLF